MVALDETITENFQIRSDVFVKPMFSNYRTLGSFRRIVHENF